MTIFDNIMTSNIVVQNIVAYGIVVFLGLLFAGVIVLIVATAKYRRKYDQAELPDLDFGDDDAEDQVEENDEEKSVFTLDFDEQDAEGATDEYSEADDMFNAVSQQPTRRELKEQEQEKKGIFGKFKK